MSADRAFRSPPSMDSALPSLSGSHAGGSTQQPGQLRLPASMIRLVHEELAWGTVVSDLEQRLAESPGDVQLRCELGGAYSQLHRHADAEKMFKKALSDAPDSAVARHGLLMSSIHVQELELCVSDYQSILYLDLEKNNFDQGSAASASADVHRALGDTLALQDKVAEARGEYAEAVKLDPKNVLAQIGLADCMLHQGSLEDAMRLYKMAISFDATVAMAYIGLGEVYRRMGKEDEAIAQYSTAMRMDAGKPTSEFVDHNTS